MNDSIRRDFRLTKIICTIGPACDQIPTLEAMANAGMNVARINMSHGSRESHLAIVRNLKSLNKKLNHPIAILADLQGPEIRTGELKEALDLKIGDEFTFTISPGQNTEERSVFVNYPDIVHDMHVGDKVALDNGLINLEVLSVSDHALRCRVLDGGTLGSRKHVNLPGIRVNLPSITEKDKSDIEFAADEDFDFIALSFVRSPDDVLEARSIIEDKGGHTRLIAKIENREGVDNFSEILKVADGVMVARGDLGVEIPLEELPIAQRRMVRECAIAGKPVIVATHLLESMIEHPMPTRAEITDVANAVYEQADAVMLSGETATGKYPVRCVETLAKIVCRMEKEPGIDFHKLRPIDDDIATLAQTAVHMADALHAPALVVMTRRGYLGGLVASFRPQTSIIYAFTNMSSVRRKLWLHRSVVPFRMDFSSDPEKTVRAAFDKLRERNRLMPGDAVVVVSDIDAGGERVDSIQVRYFH